VAKPKKKDIARDARRELTEEKTPPDVATHPQPFVPTELVGESEYSTRQAGEREALRHDRVPGGPADHEPLSAEPDALGRRFLEEATESPGPEELDPDADRERDDTLDAGQAATHVDARRDAAADPIRQVAPRGRS
jgi:hypothetical protein